MTRQESLAEFLRTWPLERIRTMTLEEYTKAGSKDTFCFWLEFRLNNLGGIGGGSAFKFGIFNRKDRTIQENRRGWCYSEEYAWHERHGATPDEAFLRIRGLVVQAIEAIQVRDLDAIEEIDLSNVLKWKSAFLFQDFEQPLVVMIFKDTSLRWLAARKGVDTRNMAECMKCLAPGWKSGEDWCEYSMDLWREWEREKPQAQEVSTDEEEGETMVNGTEIVQSFNRILYGPPGTGKTYTTRVEALTLLGEFIPEDRDEVIRHYDALAEAGQIRFVTFHPSLAYEDFVEGLRPKLDGADAGNLSYVVRDGIFKSISKDARRNWQAWQSKGAVRSFAELWSEAIAELESSGGPLVIPTRRTQFKVYEIDDDVIRFHKANGDDRHTLNAKTLEAIFEGTREVPGGLSTYYTGLAEWLKARAQGKAAVLSASLKQYVLIIDEINRGNIPAIFGELITLLEPSKRMGQSEPLEVLLPSSQERFQVPPNLHVLGTMNTADRSVEALDVALRRRFDFVEMMPDPSLLGPIEGVDLAKMLQAINARLEALVDRDHTIGHAFFMGVQDLEGLKVVFKNKVLPLLQEFFYGDWNRIGLVLGTAFVTRKGVSGSNLFAKGFEHEIDLPDRFELTSATTWDVAAFQAIYQG